MAGGNRLLEYKTNLKDHAMTLLASPWIPSGEFIASAMIKAEPGLLGWVCVHSTDNGGDIHVRIWDSKTTDTTGDVVVSEIWVTTTRAGAHRHDTYLLPGVECAKGIYAEVTAGDCSVTLGYK